MLGEGKDDLEAARSVAAGTRRAAVEGDGVSDDRETKAGAAFGP